MRFLLVYQTRTVHLGVFSRIEAVRYIFSSVGPRNHFFPICGLSRGHLIVRSLCLLFVLPSNLYFTRHKKDKVNRSPVNAPSCVCKVNEGEIIAAATCGLTYVIQQQRFSPFLSVSFASSLIFSLSLGKQWDHRVTLRLPDFSPHTLSLHLSLRFSSSLSISCTIYRLWLSVG